MVTPLTSEHAKVLVVGARMKTRAVGSKCYDCEGGRGTTTTTTRWWVDSRWLTDLLLDREKV